MKEHIKTISHHDQLGFIVGVEVHFWLSHRTAFSAPAQNNIGQMLLGSEGLFDFPIEEKHRKIIQLYGGRIGQSTQQCPQFGKSPHISLTITLNLRAVNHCPFFYSVKCNKLTGWHLGKPKK